MTEKIMENIWEKMKMTGNLTEDDKEIYLFGFYQGLILLLNIVTTLFIGIILNMFMESVLFLVCFIPLRVFAGGYHAKTQLRCYIMSTITTVFILYLIVLWREKMGTITTSCYVISVYTIWKLAPVQDKNKPLELGERRIYRKKTHTNLILVTCILVYACFRRYTVVSAAIEVTVCFLAIILFLGNWKNKMLIHI